MAQVVQGILGYAQWPHSPQQLRLCIVAPTQYTDILLASEAEESQRPVHSRRLLLDDPQLTSACEAVYVGVLPDAARQKLLERLVGYPILSISESAESCGEGSLFCLHVTDESTSFKVDLDAVARSGLKIHPRVLQLGKRLREKS
ncbi:YfiR family protein [Pseudomonas sp. ABC1]|uniref:YfiR family protein n=1 Tax=Pseudomonas sp. ABC1 TaxID=2748080 RepID=UPI0015C3F198|nr:YfiR family protein [Pseudomonas sp. ABC1]QLF94225.1 YfiR family protein [Pseudomonas sp. ABC1]